MAYVKIRNRSGIAWQTVDDEWEPQEYEEFYEGEDGEVYIEIVESTNPHEGMICCRMVGDDQLFYFDPSDVLPMDEDFCIECGQIGCGHVSAMEYFGGTF
jgi:hypothetical protein